MPELLQDVAAPRGTPEHALRSRQLGTVLLLFGGYAACYFCRADLSVATPLLIDDLGRHGIAHSEAVVRIGVMASLGVLAYALGKLFLTGLGDFWGGRPNFLLGLGGAMTFTLLFAVAGAVPVFTLAWVGNRLTQSIAWAGLIKVSSKWFDYSSYGMIIGILSISYLVGDAAARQCMALLIDQGWGWRGLFAFAGSVAAVFLVANLLWLRESRVDAGFHEAKANPLNVFGDAETRPQKLSALLLPLFRSRAFVIVCLLSLGCTIVRETFNLWTPAYLRDYAGYSMSGAAGMSAIFPAVGVASVLIAGWGSDRLGPNGRALLMFVGLTASVFALVLLTAVKPTASGPLLPALAIGMVAFCLLGPYSYLGGAFALDFGGKQAGAVSSGLIDGVGYLGGVLAGDSVARLSVAYGWRGVFAALAVITAISALAAGYLYVLGVRARRSGQHVA